MPETVKTIGTLLGYIATAIGLFTLGWTAIRKREKNVIVRESGKDQLTERMNGIDGKLDALTESLQQMVKEDRIFREKVNEHIVSQNDTNKKLLASIIEQTYYNNRYQRTLDMNEFRRVTETYEIYHGDEIKGNSYITALYDEMMTWDRVG